MHIHWLVSAVCDKARFIIVNAKTQRVGVCNAAESLLVDHAVADAFLPAAVAVLHDHGVLIHGDEATCAACADAGLAEGDDYVAATEEDWGREYLALEMSVKVVANEDEAIVHINRYGTMHSEAIIAEDVEGDALATLLVNRLRGNFNCVCVKAPGFGDRRKEMLRDIAILTGGTVISSELNMELTETDIADLGTARQVKVTKDTTPNVAGRG